MNLASVHGVEYAVAVPHNIIGARQKFDDRYRNVASIMANLMLQGRSPFIYGDGEQMRCFSHIDDCLSCLLELGLTEHGLYEVVNIGPDEEFVTINALFRKLKDIVGFEGQAVYLGDRPQEVKNAFCSSVKARELLGYRRRTNWRTACAMSLATFAKSDQGNSAITWTSRFAMSARRAHGSSD